MGANRMKNCIYDGLCYDGLYDLKLKKKCPKCKHYHKGFENHFEEKEKEEWGK